MEIKIITTGKKIELANYILAQAINALKENPNTRDAFKLTEKELNEAEIFRKQMIKSYLKKPKKLKPYG